MYIYIIILCYVFRPSVDASHPWKFWLKLCTSQSWLPLSLPLARLPPLSPSLAPLRPRRNTRDCYTVQLAGRSFPDYLPASPKAEERRSKSTREGEEKRSYRTSRVKAEADTSAHSAIHLPPQFQCGKLQLCPDKALAALNIGGDARPTGEPGSPRTWWGQLSCHLQRRLLLWLSNLLSHHRPLQ